jgi:hypothetical protein
MLHDHYKWRTVLNVMTKWKGRAFGERGRCKNLTHSVCESQCDG